MPSRLVCSLRKINPIWALILGLLFASLPATGAGKQPNRVQLVFFRKIWDRAPHNAFTDLILFKGSWYCVFREGKRHSSDDGKLRIIASNDGNTFYSAALLSSPIVDLRDPKITVTPDNRLMLNAAAALRQPPEFRHQSLVWFSADGRNWSEPAKIGDPNMWLWRITWYKGVAYSIGYSTSKRQFVRLYTSRDGAEFSTLVDNLFDIGYPNETSMIFHPDDTCLCLLRRDATPHAAQLGIAKPPYKDWAWKYLSVRLGGPHMLRLPDGRIVASGRLYEGRVRTSLLWLDPEAGTLTEFLTLPSGGDTSYPGLVLHNGLLWVRYYSSHEGKTSIYLAKVKLPPQP